MDKLTHNYAMTHHMQPVGLAYIMLPYELTDPLKPPQIVGVTNAFVPEVRSIIEASFVMYQCLSQCVEYFENLVHAIDEGAIVVHPTHADAVNKAMTGMRNDLMLVMQCAIEGIPKKATP